MILNFNLSKCFGLSDRFYLSLYIKTCLTIFLHASALSVALSQTGPIQPVSPLDLYPTPNSASLGRFGEVPISFFNGLAGVDIPLYELQGNRLSVPISLSYNAGGVRPGQHGSWTGLNWNLQAGGAITRIKNDYHDEFIEPVYNTQIGHYYNYQQLNSSNWNTVSNIFEYEDCCASGLFRKDRAADEFTFNFLGMSGSFMLGQDGQWVLKCKQQGLTFKVETAVSSYQFTYPDTEYGIPTSLYNIFTKFILTGPDGTRYVFGDTPTSIEFNRLGGSYGNNRDSQFSIIVVASSWYLTKIISVSGEQIIFDYERRGYQVVGTSSSYAMEYSASGKIEQSCWYIGKRNCDASNSAYSSRLLIPHFYIQDPVYLKKITSSKGIVEFIASRSSELDYSNQTIFSHCGGSTSYYGTALQDVWRTHCRTLVTQEDIAAQQTNFCNFIDQECWGIPVSKWYKLNSIVIKKPDNAQVKEFAFSYHENPNARLFLTALQEKSSNGTATVPPYRFEYYGNPTDLPAYMSYKIDHWGYFNNTSEIENPSGPLPGLGFPSNTFLNNYAAKRAPNPAVMHISSLRRISYPTGGYTELEYEPHTYSKLVNSSTMPFSINQRTSNTTAGGLRIKKITSKNLYNSPDLVKTYFYVEDYLQQNMLSSGVLSTLEPQYVESNTINGNPTVTYRYWYSNNILPAHTTNGNHVTYTKVTEVDQDGSFKVYTYSNHDNGYINKEAQAFFVGSANDFWSRNSSSLEIERGLLLNEKFYKSVGQLVEERQYEYNNDPNRFNTAVRYLQANPKTFNLSPQGIYHYINTSTLLFYGYYPFLKRMNHIRYDQDDPAKFIQTNVSYAYNNPYRQVIETSTATSLTNQIAISRTKYTSDYNAGSLNTPDPVTNAITRMKASHMLLPVEKQEWIKNGPDEKILSAQLIKYRDFLMSGYQPSQVLTLAIPSPVSGYSPSSILSSGAFAHDSRFEVRAQFTAYDDKGNLLEQSAQDNIPLSYVWSMNKTFPIAQVTNARQNQIFHTSFEEGNFDQTQSLTGSQCLNGDYAFVPPSGFAPVANSVLSYWYWTAADQQWRYQQQAYSGGSVTLSLGDKIDEVRIYPAEARMNTATYHPLFGKTSQTDQAHLTTYYEYDGLGRLKLIRDHKRNIVKTLQYRYKQ